MLAAQNSSPDLDAITSLSREYRAGKEVEKSKEKADALMKKAADMGSRRAQDSVAIHLLWDNEKNVVTADAVYYATLLATGERPNFIHFGAGIYSAYVLGLAFNYGQGGMEINPYLARHYFKIAVQGNTNASEHAGMNFPEGYEGAYCFYGEALITLGLEQYGGTSVPGFIPIPKAMYWFHKASTLGCEGCDNPDCSKEKAKRRGRSWMDAVKLEESKRCSYCLKLAEDCLGGKLKNCARCLGAWYCGRDCQAAAWKAGHKLDCVKLSGPKEAALH
jgi:TPR repeat protein